MVQLTIAQINVELNYLEENYQRLTIKTAQYQVEKKRLQDQKKVLLKLDDKELAVIETQKKDYKTSTLKNKFMKSNGSAIQESGRFMVDED
jgi:Fe-S cluster assembly iron-binding protein IscA